MSERVATFKPADGKLFHVSEQGDIERFEPRSAPDTGGGDERPLVWAVDTDHLVNYLVPRDCPRVCFAAGARTSLDDRAAFLGLTEATRVVVIESAWHARATEQGLWIYSMPTEPFSCVDANAGYHVSTSTVVPAVSRFVDRPLMLLHEMRAELRLVHNLQSLAASVAASTLEFSCIRMRNAQAGHA